MRIILIHPNNQSGGAEIAGRWSPASVAYLVGYLQAAGYTDIRFVDAMTDKLSEDRLRAELAAEAPDIVGAAITPSMEFLARLPDSRSEACGGSNDRIDELSQVHP
ncbi:hypothetical protein [Rhodopseudomonas sp.]|uniref:hypothetical protein n=1 Tax=Rhodopseudomonas sp. TaxID=1078 RepID=UPI0039C96AFD